MQAAPHPLTPGHSGRTCSKLPRRRATGTAVADGVFPSLYRALPSECQMLLFSATFEDSVWQFAERTIPDPNVIKLRKEELTLNNIRQYYVLCENRKDKYQALCNIYGGITIGQAIIFCQVMEPGSVLVVPGLGHHRRGGDGLRARHAASTLCTGGCLIFRTK